MKQDIIFTCSDELYTTVALIYLRILSVDKNVCC